jgi:hypothetical protein
MNKTVNSKITLYALKLTDQTITADEFSELNAILSSDADAARYYNYIMMTIYHFTEQGKDIICDEMSIDSIMNDAAWKELADYEKTAQEITLHPENPRQELIQKVVYPPKEKRKLSKFSIYMLLNTAAIVLFFVLLRFAPPKGAFEVATLMDSLDAKWANDSLLMEKGTRIVTGNKRLLLSEGYVKLLFDNQTQVTVEGPAEFQILAEDRIGLSYGKVYSSVPAEAIGFSVYTPNAKIIDMGTEFGVLAEVGGHTQVHVLKGKTMLMGGAASRVNMEVNEGFAKAISGETGEISDVVCRYDYFVRDIHSESHIVWRGQDRINLADIVGGGNGFGTGKTDEGINPTSGEPAQVVVETQTANNDFRPAAFNPYVDGVFVPDGRTTQVVSSQGHVFAECPVTSGECFNNVLNAFRLAAIQAYQDAADLETLQYAPCILLHANIGITFDLQALRSLLPDFKMVRFQSLFKIEIEAVRPDLSNADFWVLVDGELRDYRTQVKSNELWPVDIELSETDRFLTLVVTDGQDPKIRVIDNVVFNEIHSDWGMFVDPVLVLELK